jgi:hypothetical protein
LQQGIHDFGHLAIKRLKSICKDFNRPAHKNGAVYIQLIPNKKSRIKNAGLKEVDAKR